MNCSNCVISLLFVWGLYTCNRFPSISTQYKICFFTSQLGPSPHNGVFASEGWIIRSTSKFLSVIVSLDPELIVDGPWKNPNNLYGKLPWLLGTPSMPSLVCCCYCNTPHIHTHSRTLYRCNKQERQLHLSTARKEVSALDTTLQQTFTTKKYMNNIIRQ